MKYLVLFFALQFLSLNAMANNDSKYIYTGAWSHHFQEYYRDGEKHLEYNENHNLIGYEQDGFMISRFTNSFNVDGAVIGKKIYEYTLFNDFQASLYVGGAYGYSACIGEKSQSTEFDKWCPAVVPVIAYTRFKVEPIVLVIGDAIAFSIRWEFK